jgi:hypothetical protein
MYHDDGPKNPYSAVGIGPVTKTRADRAPPAASGRRNRARLQGPGDQGDARESEHDARRPGTPHGLAGSGWIDIDKTNVKDYAF